MGDRLGHLQQGIYTLASNPRIFVEAASSLYETDFVGEGEQDPYLNTCLQLRTTLSPHELLSVLKAAELDRGRKPASHMQPRPLDLDVLFFGSRHFCSDHLTVPHPRMAERTFVLVPLSEIAPGKRFPDSGETVARVCAKIQQDNENGLMVRDDLSLLTSRPDHKEE